MDVGHANKEGIDFGFADVVAVQSDVRVDVEPTHVQTHSAFVGDHVVQTGLQRDAEGIVQIQIAQGRVLFEEDGVVQTRADIGCQSAATDGGAKVTPSKEVLEQMLVEHKGVVAQVARALGRSTKQVYRWMARQGLDPADYRA